MNLFAGVHMLVGAPVQISSLAPVGLKLLGRTERANALGDSVTCGTAAFRQIGAVALVLRVE